MFKYRRAKIAKTCGSAAMLWLVFSSFSINAEIYKWVDENGRVHYGDNKPADFSVEPVDSEINTVEGQHYDFLPESSLDQAEPVSVVMYATSWCPYCSKARKYFKSRGIPFTEYDIEKNSQANKTYRSLGGNGVPLIVVGDKQMSGFSRDRFDALYDDR